MLASLIALQTSSTGYKARQVLTFDVPAGAPGTGGAASNMFQEVSRRVSELPGVRGVAVGSMVPWRDAGTMISFPFKVEGYTPANGEDMPFARWRFATPNFFAVLGVPLVSGREFNDDDRRLKGDTREPAVIVSETVARRLFPDGDAVNRSIEWTDPFMTRFGPRTRRIVGVVADVDDENLVPAPTLTIYESAFEFGALTKRLFVHAAGHPQAPVPAITKVIRDVSPNQPVERAATLEEVRAEAMAPDRLNTFVVSGFAGIALLIAIVGGAGVLASLLPAARASRVHVLDALRTE